MGIYLNSRKPFQNYQEVVKARYFVYKTFLLNELIPIVPGDQKNLLQNKGEPAGSNKYICITRPRRFGKTIMANMIAAYFGKGCDSRGMFAELGISANEQFEAHLNRHNVISIPFNEMPRDCRTYRQH